MSEENKFVKVNRLDDMEKPTLPLQGGAVHPAPHTPAVNGTPAERIWNHINGLPLEMFGLPNKKVSDYCTPVSVEPSKLYLTARASAVLPALETALQHHYVVELAGKWIVVSPAPVPLAPQK